MASEGELTVEDLRALAVKVDAGQAVEVETETDVERDSEPSTEQEPEDTPSQDEIEKAAAEADKDSAKSSDTTVELKKESKDQKEQDRYDRNWKKFQEEKAALEKREKEIAEREAKLVKSKDLRDEVDTDGYSVKDYEFAVNKFREEGNPELAAEADRKAKGLYFQAFQKVWKANMETLIDEHPDLSDSRKPLTQACDQVLKTLPFLRTIPDGCKYAVRIALGDTSSTMVSELRAENKKLKEEVEKFNKSSRLSGSLPSRLPAGKTFDDLSDKERLNHLRDLAAAADRGEISP